MVKGCFCYYINVGHYQYILLYFTTKFILFIGRPASANC